jgi:transcriptional regulator GlxA family with amidase domain
MPIQRTFTIFPPLSASSSVVNSLTGGVNPSEAGQAICDTDASNHAIVHLRPCETLEASGIVTKHMATCSKTSGVRRHSSSRRIVVVVVPPVDELDLVGPLQVFNSVNRLAGRNIYAIEFVTNADRLTVEGEGGVLTFMAKHHFKKVTGACDSVLLVCGMGSRSVRDAALSAWLKKMAAEVRRLGAVCVGAFLLAEAGLLNERRATTHWRFGREMAMRYPGVRVQHDPLWVKDGNIYTSAGISAGIDLALAWVEEDCGACLAHEAARELVLFLRRPGGQPQLSVSLASQASEMMSIRELQIWIAEHLQTKLSVEDLADRMAMSVRNFERVFTREVGTTPSQYVLQIRVEAARRQLELTERVLKQVASSAGFGNVDVMRRAFVRLLGITPRCYRELAERSTGK